MNKRELAKVFERLALYLLLTLLLSALLSLVLVLVAPKWFLATAVCYFMALIGFYIFMVLGDVLEQDV